MLEPINTIAMIALISYTNCVAIMCEPPKPITLTLQDGFISYEQCINKRNDAFAKHLINFKLPPSINSFVVDCYNVVKL